VNFADRVRVTGPVRAVGVDRELVVLTNGAADAIALVAAEERIGAVVEPEFSASRSCQSRRERSPDDSDVDPRTRAQRDAGISGKYFDKIIRWIADQ
jgi:hypothetical protein